MVTREGRGHTTIMEPGGHTRGAEHLWTGRVAARWPRRASFLAGRLLLGVESSREAGVAL